MERHVWVLQVLAGVWAVWTGVVADRLWWALLGLVFFGGAAWWSSPWWGGRSPRREQVLALPGEERPVVVYWRPGCLFCARLRRDLGDLGERAHWVNIWQDRDAAAFVRSVNGGSETVPTVVLDGEPHTNPGPALVCDRLDQPGAGDTQGGDAR